MASLLLTLATPDGTGAPRMAAAFAGALRAADHRVIMACGRLPRDAAEGEEAMRRDFEAAGVETRTVAGLERRYHPGAVSALVEIARAEDVRCLLGFQFRDHLAVLLAARRAGLPCLISAQNRHRFWGSPPVRRFKTAVLARAMRRAASLVVCSSEPVQREVIGFGVAPGRAVVLPNAIDVRRFEATPDPERSKTLRAEFGADDGRLLLLNVGRLDAQKGQADLLAALAGLESPAAHLVLVGDITPTQRRRTGRYAEGLRSFAKNNGLAARVTFAGWRDDVAQLLGAADVYVHSAHWEGWPLAVMEAMAAARPVIFTDCAGPPAGFEDGTHGRMVPTADPSALRMAMSEVLALTPAERTAMGEAGRRLVTEHLDIRVIGRRFVDLVEGLL